MLNLNYLKNKLNLSTKAQIIVDLANIDLNEAKEALDLLNDNTVEFAKHITYYYNLGHNDKNRDNSSYQEFKHYVQELINQTIIQSALKIGNSNETVEKKLNDLRHVFDALVYEKNSKVFHKMFKNIEKIQDTHIQSLYLSTLIHYFNTSLSYEEEKRDMNLPLYKKEKEVLVNLFFDLNVESQVMLLTQSDINLYLHLTPEYFKDIEKIDYKPI